MNEFLLWLSNETNSVWWNDSANIDELENALEMGALGVTTNPVLVTNAIYSNPDKWKPYFKHISADMSAFQKAEEIIKCVTCRIAEIYFPIYEKTAGMQGFVCAQVDPREATNRDSMFDMAKRLHAWAPNIAVKLPVTYAGLDVLEECAAIGITVVGTVSFTMPQAVEIGRRYQIGLERAKKAGIKPGRCFAVVMVGRIDDYIRDVVLDRKMNIKESDIIQCGIAIIKRAYSYFKEHGYEAELMPAGMRGGYHVTSLADAEMSMSIHPKIQKMLLDIPKPYTKRINVPMDTAVIDRLKTISEFARSYEPDGIKPEDFITCGIVQKTLSQFIENWMLIESFPLSE